MNSNVCFFYHRERYNVTIAYKRVQGEFGEDHSIIFGAAFCNSSDPFVKARGREIAIGRMNLYEDAVTVSPVAARWQVHEKILGALSQSSTRDYVPNNFRCKAD